jgi:hypothetical protein
MLMGPPATCPVRVISLSLQKVSGSRFYSSPTAESQGQVAPAHTLPICS